LTFGRLGVNLFVGRSLVKEGRCGGRVEDTNGRRVEDTNGRRVEDTNGGLVEEIKPPLPSK